MTPGSVDHREHDDREHDHIDDRGGAAERALRGELYTIDGGGHAWPGSPINVPRLGANTDQIDANDLILDFFAERPLAEV